MPKRTRPPARQDAIVERIRQMIVLGELAPGDRLPAHSEIQKRFKTCAATVQRAFDRLTKAGFVSVRGRTGSFVAERPPHRNRFALSFPANVTEPEWVRFWSVLEQVARELEEDLPCEMPTYHAVLPNRPDGGYATLSRDVEERCLAGMIFVTDPHPLLGTPLIEAPDIPRVAILSTEPPKGVLALDLDAHAFIDRALDLLASRQRRRIALLVPPGIEDERLEYFHRALAERGMSTAPHWIQAAALSEPKWAANLARVMLRGAEDDRPDGLIITDDNLVEHACAGVVGAGRTVPDDLDVVAHCNFPAPVASVLAIERLGYDARQILNTCVDLLTRAREGRRVPARTVIAPVFESEVPPRPERTTRPGAAPVAASRASNGRVG